MHIVLSNKSPQPLYAQIKEQIRDQIMTGELAENEMMPSLRQLAKDLKSSVLTVQRAYNELEQEGFIESHQGKGFYVSSSSAEIVREALVREIEANLSAAIDIARNANMTNEAFIELTKLLLEVNDDE